ncbi:hypothetical protein B484DRAFT_449052 [Ochromonadaceae sp. CCMP2298]|nr:hypothetical protein B484DRAFT_449052 [Ochromonadaceae sp. CCMP2298]
MTGCSMTGCSMTGGAGGVAGGFAGLLGTGGAMRGLVRALALGATSASVFGDAYEDLQGPFPCLQLLLGLLSLGLYVEVGAVLHQAWGNVVTIGTGEMEDIEGTEETEETDEMEMGGMKDEPIHQHQGRPTDQGPTPTPDLRDLPTLCAAIASHDPRVAYLHSEGFFPYLLRMLTAAQGDLQFCAEVAHSSLVSPHLAHAHPHVCRTLNGALMTVSPLSIAGTGGKGDVGGAEDVGGAGGESEEGVSLDSLFRAMTLEMLLCLASGTPLRPVRSLLYPETGACAGAGVGAGCVTYPTSSSASARTSTSTSALSALIPWQQPLQVGELRTLVLHRLQPSPSSSPSPLPAESVNFSSPGTAAGVVVAGLTGVDISARVRVVQSVLQGGTTFAQLLTGALTREGGGGGSGGSEGRDGKDVYQSGFDCAWFWAACLLHSAPLSHISTPIPDFSAMEACATHILHSHRGGFAVHVLASVGAPLSLLLRPLFCYWFHTVGVGAVGAVGAGDIPLALAAMALYTGGRGPALAAAALVLRCADACVAEVVTLEGLLRQMRISSQLDLGSLLDEMQAIAFLEGEILALLLLRP